MKIKTLKILSSNLQAQAAFYAQVLGLELLKQTDDEVQFKLGYSIMSLKQDEGFQPYHFAINIPANKEQKALEWLQERVDILKDGVHEIQDFDFWNAKAIYFYDKDENIVELIARKNLNNGTQDEFGVHALLGLSEIGMPVDDIAQTYDTLKQLVPLEVFDGGFERFCAIGDENGLFICINKHRKDWFPTNDKAHASPFEVEVEVGQKVYSLQFARGRVSTI